MKRSVVNVLSVVNSKNITNEIIEGDEHIVVSDIVPVIDDIVMNKGLYPADEIDKGYSTLDGKLMPLGHPKSDGRYISANEAIALNKFYVGAWCVNARKEGEKVLVDMKVNKRIANSSDSGKRLIEALEDLTSNEAAKPIHISTGLNLQKEYRKGNSKGKKYDWVATNMQFDHVAILLDEQGAATPEQGVGIFVNSEGEESEVEFVNLADSADYTKETLLDKVKYFFSANSSLSFEEIHGLLLQLINNDHNSKKWLWIESVYPSHFIYNDDGKKYKQKYLIDDNSQVSFVGERIEVVKKVDYDEIKTNGENIMKEKILSALNAAGVKTEGLDDDQLLSAYNELQAKPKDEGVKTINSEINEAIKTAVATAIAPLQEKLQANEDAKVAEMREAVKSKFSLSDVAVNSLSSEALSEMFAKTKNSNGLNNSLNANSEENQWGDYKLNQEESK
ncbi:TPA: DUF2213 domain-containing protein [Pasteurella multocida]|uniref:DUF2213 domain-containing protein n=1 Tax=Pasteurella multocida TaxID=747 RepID=UPI0008FA1AE9|nr:DUF2213 domain-containing protein [Pasteurella multocida]MBE7395076.1 DUF2213 domain-containing protein [Pasteurella multocida]MCL7774765.1 DUF2213 domain-containing protein [Pasteurella multocida]MCL7828341.1 DUF2213 domain-containing protein [Pasteurella multocida]MCL7836470.1 DUF2213 domain-containing protein [Pasteurella multocida]MDA5619224.1 DUF2213 domain-containing protein [Pasteurella multocida subsp. multocida]